MELTEREWRTIHNALAVYQAQTHLFGKSYKINYEQKRAEIQCLMDKIRDNFIQPQGRNKDKYFDEIYGED